MTLEILLSNDDGIYSSGIRNLARAMFQRTWDVTVIAPQSQRSGESKAITFDSPVRMQEVSLSYLEGKSGWRTTVLRPMRSFMGFINVQMRINCRLI